MAPVELAEIEVMALGWVFSSVNVMLVPAPMDVPSPATRAEV